MESMKTVQEQVAARVEEMQRAMEAEKLHGTRELAAALELASRSRHRGGVSKLCAMGAEKIEELTERCARYAEEIAVLRERERHLTGTRQSVMTYREE